MLVQPKILTEYALPEAEIPKGKEVMKRIVSAFAAMLLLALAFGAQAHDYGGCAKELEAWSKAAEASTKLAKASTKLIMKRLSEGPTADAVEFWERFGDMAAATAEVGRRSATYLECAEALQR